MYYSCRKYVDFLFLGYSLLKRGKTLIFAILTLRKPASFNMQLTSSKVVPAQATQLPICQKAISTQNTRLLTF